jgi:hypothetical protein
MLIFRQMLNCQQSPNEVGVTRLLGNSDYVMGTLSVHAEG